MYGKMKGDEKLSIQDGHERLGHSGQGYSMRDKLNFKLGDGGLLGMHFGEAKQKNGLVKSSREKSGSG